MDGERRREESCYKRNEETMCIHEEKKKRQANMRVIAPGDKICAEEAVTAKSTAAVTPDTSINDLPLLYATCTHKHIRSTDIRLMNEDRSCFRKSGHPKNAWEKY